jgi:hypothetical protein
MSGREHMCFRRKVIHVSGEREHMCQEEGKEHGCVRKKGENTGVSEGREYICVRRKGLYSLPFDTYVFPSS